MSEKRDLWVPVVLAAGGVFVLIWHALADDGYLWAGLAAALLGFFAAIACLPIRLRHGQVRVMTFGLGAALLIACVAPGASPSAAHLVAWIVAALAFLIPIENATVRVRAVMLGAAAVFALLAVLAMVGVVPGHLTWLLVSGALFMVVQVWNSRYRPPPEVPPGQRVCVFGGTFDPFHRGHRALAQAALRQNDRLLIVAAGSAPHKFLGEEGSVPERTPFHHRVSMTRLGVEGLPRTEVLEMEGKRSGPSYTVDTLEVLHGSHPPGTRFRLLIGADMLQDFANWKEWRRILEMATLLVAERPGSPSTVPEALAAARADILPLEIEPMDVSATDLREALRRGEEPARWLSPAILAYIREHDLYQPVEPQRPKTRRKRPKKG